MYLFTQAFSGEEGPVPAAVEEPKTTILKILLSDFYTKAVTPNKEFIFNFNDYRLRSGYSGYYRMTESNFHFKKSGNVFLVTGDFTFIKKEDITQAEKDAIDKIIIPDKPVKKPSEKQ